MQLHFKPNGDVLACCWSLTPLGNIAHTSLQELWAGPERSELIEHLSRDDFTYGCDQCAVEIEHEGRLGSHPDGFEHWRAESANAWPRRLEFEISNACNLQCTQCSGDYSSAIRLHREHRPPLAPVYDDQFFDDLTAFIPHLADATFAGGEPFMAGENFRIWDLLAELNPSAHVMITTNGTHWTRRVEQVLDQLNPDITVSLDGATQATYESIRTGASFHAVMTNLDRFVDRVRDSESSVEINFCWMPQNRHELIDVLEMAESKGVLVNVVDVRGPVECSIQLLDADHLDAIADALDRRIESAVARLALNGSRLVEQRSRLESWRTAARSDGATDGVRSTILMFRRNGLGPTDPDQLEESLRSEGIITWRLDVDSLDRISSCSEAFADRIGVLSDELVGHPPSRLTAHLRRWELLRSDEDRADVGITFRDGTEATVVLVPDRDDLGRADSASMIVALRPPET